MRRGARAYQDAYGSDSGVSRLFVSPEWPLQRLAEFPRPLHTNQSGLDLVEVAGPPLAPHLLPTEHMQGALSLMLGPRLVGYTMAAFWQAVHHRADRGSQFSPSRLRARCPRRPSPGWRGSSARPGPPRASGSSTPRVISPARTALTVTVETDGLVAFGDGMAADHLTLRWGQQVTIAAAGRTLRLVV